MAKGEKLPLLPSDLISSGLKSPGTNNGSIKNQNHQLWSLRLVLLLLTSSILLYVSPPILSSLSFSSFFPSHRHLTPNNFQQTSDSKREFPDVSFDKSSMTLLGQRIVIQSGEFHPWRLPVTDLWYVSFVLCISSGGANSNLKFCHMWGY